MNTLPADFDALFAALGIRKRDWTKAGGQK